MMVLKIHSFKYFSYFPAPFISVLLYLWWKGVTPTVERGSWPKLAGYCGCSFFMSFTPYVAVEHLPLASGAAIRYYYSSTDSCNTTGSLVPNKRWLM